MTDRMALSAHDYLTLQTHGPTRISQNQYMRTVEAVERIKWKAFWEGRRAENATQRAQETLTTNE